MGLDSYSRKSLEQRAKENDRAIDMQWIKENETNDIFAKLDNMIENINEEEHHRTRR